VTAGRPREWTAEDDALLRDLYLEGKSTAYIADRFETSTENIRQRISRMGVRRPPRASSSNPPRKARAQVVDIASRIAALLGEAPLPPVRPTEISDADLLRFTGRHSWPPEATAAVEEASARWILETPQALGTDSLERVLGLRAFASELCHMELDGPQLAMARAVLASKRVVVLAGRRSGKSFALGAVAAWTAVCVPNSHVVVVAAADRQAKEVAERVVMPMFAQDDRLFASIRSSNKEVMELRNGSLVRFLPATGQIRGIGASLLLVDEGRDILDEDLVYSSVEPMLANSNGSMAIWSTPWMASGKLWDVWHSPFYAKVRAPSRDSRFVSQEFVEQQRNVMSHELFQAELEAEFMQTVAAYFSSVSISRCLRDVGLVEAAEEGRTYALGVDFGRFRDASVFVVASRGEDGRLRVDWVRAFVNVPLSDQRSYAKYMDDVFHVRWATVEAAGLGIQISEEIAKDLPGRVTLFKPTIDEKARAFENLKGFVERGEIDIPRDPPQLAAQMRSLAFEATASGVKIHGTHGSADDYVHALAYAVRPFRKHMDGPGAARINLRPSREASRSDRFQERFRDRREEASSEA
jgi:terminase large subunit-like protein